MKITDVYLIISFMFCELFAVGWSDLPPEIQKCKSTDNDECVAKTTQNMLKLYPNGNPAIGMPDISAFNASNIKVSRSNPNSPVQISFEFIKCTMYGLENIKILKASGFDKQLKHVELKMFAPSVRMIGDYEMMGKILLLPINGKGKGEVNLKSFNMTIQAKIDKLEPRDNKTYMKLNKLKALVEPKRMIVNFENLFNGNEVLSKTLNEVINENWRDVWTELQAGINHAMELITENIISNIFEVITFEEIYLD